MVGTEIFVRNAVLEDVVDRGEHLGSNGADGLLRTAFAAQPIELGLVVAVLLAARGPSALNQHRLEPRRAFAQARGFAVGNGFSPRVGQCVSLFDLQEPGRDSPAAAGGSWPVGSGRAPAAWNRATRPAHRAKGY